MRQKGNRCLALFLALSVTMSSLSGIPAGAEETAVVSEADAAAAGREEQEPETEEETEGDVGPGTEAVLETAAETGEEAEPGEKDETKDVAESGAEEEEVKSEAEPGKSGEAEETETESRIAAETGEESESGIEEESEEETEPQSTFEDSSGQENKKSEAAGETVLPTPETDQADVPQFMAGRESDAGVRLLKGDKTEFAMFVVSDSTAEIRNGEIAITISTANTGYHELYLGMKTDEPKTPVISGTERSEGGWSFSFTVPLEKNGQDIPVCIRSRKSGEWYAKADLILTIPRLELVSEPEPKPETKPETPSEHTYDVLEVDSSASMFKVTDCVLTSKDGRTGAVLTLSGTGYDYLYVGSAAEAARASSTEWIPFVENGAGAYTYALPEVALDVPFAVAAHSKKNDKWYDRTLTFKSESRKRVAKEGDYRTEVESNASMFRVVNCVLTAKGGSMHAVLTLSGTGYDYLYLGTAADAQASLGEGWISFAEGGDGAYRYEIPVSALDVPISVAAHSKKNDKWYDRTLTFQTEGALKLSGGTEQPGGQEKPGDNGSQTKPPAADHTADAESAYESDVNGSTRQVDSSVTLPDGVYKPDKFSWSGGTGRVNITCPKITVTRGRAYATLVFSSDSYTYLKANGNRYSGSVGGGTSTFVIPVELNKNNTIIGMTTKMSASHEIVYSIYIYLAAAENGGEAGGVNGLAGETLDEEAPKILGLTYESETKVEYAEQFKIYHYNDGITLLEIGLTRGEKDGDENFPEENAPGELKVSEEAGEDSEESVSEADEEALEEDGADGGVILTDGELTAKLYQEQVVKYLLVPEDAELPVGLEKEAVIIRLPAEKTYVASSEALMKLEQLGILDVVTAVGFEKEECPVESLGEAMEVKTGEAEVAFGGLFHEPDFKTLLSRKCGLALLPGEVLPKESEEAEEDAADRALSSEEQKERFEKLTERFSMLSIPVILDGSADEETELASYEWIKVYGVLFDREKEAEELFEAAVKAAEKAETKEKTEGRAEG